MIFMKIAAATERKKKFENRPPECKNPRQPSSRFARQPPRVSVVIIYLVLEGQFLHCPLIISMIFFRSSGWLLYHTSISLSSLSTSSPPTPHINHLTLTLVAAAIFMSRSFEGLEMPLSTREICVFEQPTFFANSLCERSPRTSMILLLTLSSLPELSNTVLSFSSISSVISYRPFSRRDMKPGVVFILSAISFCVRP